MIRSFCVQNFLAMILAAAAVAQTSEMRSLLVDVLDKKTDTQVDRLTAANFKVTVDGRPVRVASVSHEKVKASVAVLLDSSGSMAAGWGEALELAEQTIERLPRGHVSLIVFSDDWHPVRTVNGAEAAVEALERIRYMDPKKPFALGRTALWDGIAFAVNSLKLKSGDAVILITDGGDNTSSKQESDVEKLVLESGVRVFSLYVESDGGPATPEERSGPVTLNAFAQKTGATMLELGNLKKRGKTGVGILADYLVRRIYFPYALTVEIPPDARGKIKVEAVNASGERERGMSVCAPSRVWEEVAAAGR